MRSSQLVEFASASRTLRPPTGPGSDRRYARCLLALGAHGRRRRRPCARRAGRRRAAPECRVDREGEARRFRRFLLASDDAIARAPGGFGVIATLLLRTPGTRSPWNPVRLSSQLVAWPCVVECALEDLRRV